MVFWPFCGCAETGTGETANDFEGWSVCRILHGSAHSIPRAAHAERFELFAAFVQLLAGQVNADGRAGLTRLCQSSMPYSPSRARQLGSPHVRGLLGTLRERRAVELDTFLPALGRLAAALGVQMPWIPFSAPGRTGFGREGEAGRGMGARHGCPGSGRPATPRRDRPRASAACVGGHGCVGACGILSTSAGRRPKPAQRPCSGRARRLPGADRPHRRPPRTGPVLSRTLAVHPHGRRADRPGCGGDLSRPVAAASAAGCLRARRADQSLGHRGADVGLGGHRGHPPGALVGRS